jgi:hypothetical protein
MVRATLSVAARIYSGYRFPRTNDVAGICRKLMSLVFAWTLSNLLS